MKKAQRTSKTRRYHWTPPSVPDVRIWRDQQKERDWPGRFSVPYFGPGGDTPPGVLGMYERIEKQMRELQKRIEELERPRGEKPERDQEEEPQENTATEEVNEEGKI